MFNLMTFVTLFRLLRIKQYYKNLLIFLPLIFISQLFNPLAFFRVILGFIVLCLVSSSYYILNDVIDRKKDINHPEKKNRPIASRKVNLFTGILFSLILLAIGLIISLFLDYVFFITVFSLFLLTIMYSFYFKNILFLDIIFISINFVLRPLSGVFIIFPNQVIRISPWLILVPFFLALFLATAKRRSNLIFLGTEQKYNLVLNQYDQKTTSFLFSTSTTLLIFNYSLFTFFSDFPLLLITIPVVLYAIFYFYKQVEEGSIIGRDLFFAIKNKNLLLSLLVWLILTFLIIYF